MNLRLKMAILERYGVRGQYRLAQALGLSETTLSRVVSGRRAASEDERQAIAEELGRDELELFDATDAETSTG